MKKNTKSIPYVGSKQGIALELIDEMLKYKPNAKVFVDLFGGGGAMSLTILNFYPQFKKIIYNDFNTNTYLMVKYCLFELPYEKDLSSLIVDRKTFKELLEKENKTGKDITILNINSFGNMGVTYLWSVDIEDIKLDLSRYVLNPTQKKRQEIKEKYDIEISDLSTINDMSKRRSILQNEIKEIKAKTKAMQRIKNDAKIKSLLQRLQSLQSLESYKELKTYRTDYENVPIPDGDVLIYADIPYINTNSYQKGGFDHERFYKWLENIDKPVIVSEYTQPPHTVKIASIKKARLMNNNGSGGYAEEGLFINEHFFDWYVERMGLKKPLVWITKGSYKQAQLIF